MNHIILKSLNLLFGQALRASAPDEPLAGPIARDFISKLNTKLAAPVEKSTYVRSPDKANVGQFSVTAVIPPGNVGSSNDGPPIRVCAKGLVREMQNGKPVMESGQEKWVPSILGTWTLNNSGIMNPDPWNGPKVPQLNANGEYPSPCAEYVKYYMSAYNQAAGVAAPGTAVPARPTGPQ